MPTTHTAPAASTSHARSDSAPKPTLRTLDDLLALAPAQLEELYRGAKTPRLTDLHGDLEGRMLASPLGGEGLAKTMRALASWRHFPWRGKSFTPHGEARGEGINRVLTDENRWFRFETFIGKSRAGDFDALQLDYDNPGNPFFIRAIKDEVRTLSPGVFLGQAWALVGQKATLALYFALASRA